MKLKEIFLLISFLLIVNLLNFQIISAVEWVEGSLHQHTGYSTWWGYDGNPLTFGDDCQPRALELHFLGYTVEELKEEALNLDLNWLAFSDHSYCINSSEFNTVKTDCQNAQDSSFSCLWGERR